MLLNTSIVALENTVTPEGLVLYLAVLCVLMAVVIGAGIFFAATLFGDCRTRILVAVY